MIHPSAYVSQNAKVADSACIGPWCIVEDFAEIGENVVLESRVHVLPFVKIGAETRIFDGASLGNDESLVMAYVHVAHDCQIGKGVVISNRVQLAGHVQIGDYANLGGTAGVSQNCRIGAYSFVGAALKVDKDVPPYVKALGNPLRFAGVNLHALRRFPERFSVSRMVEIEKLYRDFFHSRCPVEEKAKEMVKCQDSTIRDFFLVENRPLIR